MSPAPPMLRVGSWCVDPLKGQISRGEESARLESPIRLDARVLRLLLYLAERPGVVVSTEDLLSYVWAGVAVTQDSVYQAIASLRRSLGDDPKQPAYIVTVPRLGYRLIAEVGACESQIGEGDGRTAAGRRSRRRLFWLTALAAGLVCAAGLWLAPHLRGKSAPGAVAVPMQRSIAVLPFLDLTPGMTEGEFADGMTEELIGRLSKVPGLKVPSPTSSFYFKDKQVPLAEMARSLGVAYVLDGSVRKSGERVRVAARLVQAGNGYVLWTETYDRPYTDVLAVQDEIAGAVVRALRASPVLNP